MMLMQTLEQMTQKMKKEMSDNNDDMTEIFEELSNPLKLDIQELYDVLGTDDELTWGCNENIINTNINKHMENVESAPVLTEELVGEILDDIIDEQPDFIDKEISEEGIDISRNDMEQIDCVEFNKNSEDELNGEEKSPGNQHTLVAKAKKSKQKKKKRNNRCGSKSSSQEKQCTTNENNRQY